MPFLGGRTQTPACSLCEHVLVFSRNRHILRHCLASRKSPKRSSIAAWNLRRFHGLFFGGPLISAFVQKKLVFFFFLLNPFPCLPCALEALALKWRIQCSKGCGLGLVHLIVGHAIIMVNTLLTMLFSQCPRFPIIPCQPSQLPHPQRSI